MLLLERWVRLGVPNTRLVTRGGDLEPTGKDGGSGDRTRAQRKTEAIDIDVERPERHDGAYGVVEEHAAAQDGELRADSHRVIGRPEASGVKVAAAVAGAKASIDQDDIGRIAHVAASCDSDGRMRHGETDVAVDRGRGSGTAPVRDAAIVATFLGRGRGGALAAARGAKRRAADVCWAGGRIWPCTAATAAVAAGTVALLGVNVAEQGLQ